MASVTWQECGRCFAGYISEKSAKSVRDRHIRETHTSDDTKRRNVESRLLRGRAYAKDVYWTDAQAGESQNTLFVVLCHRDSQGWW